MPVSFHNPEKAFVNGKSELTLRLSYHIPFVHVFTTLHCKFEGYFAYYNEGNLFENVLQRKKRWVWLLGLNQVFLCQNVDSLQMEQYVLAPAMLK